jgi:SAM-dependent methyltransferase
MILRTLFEKRKSTAMAAAFAVALFLLSLSSHADLIGRQFFLNGKKAEIVCELDSPAGILLKILLLNDDQSSVYHPVYYYVPRNLLDLVIVETKVNLGDKSKLVAPSSSGAPTVVAILPNITVDPLTLITSQIASNSFNVTRSLIDYTFSSAFFRRLADLDANGHWIDVGCGDGMALEQFITGKLRSESARKWMEERIETWPEWKKDWAQNIAKMENMPLHKKPQVSGVTFTTSRETPDFAGKFRILTGQFFEDLAPDALEKADLVTDYMGAFAYSTQVDQVVQKYLDVLKPNGEAHILYAYEIPSSDLEHFSKGSGIAKTTIKTLGGENLSLVKWLEKNDTIKIKREIEPTLDSSENSETCYNVNLVIMLKQGVVPYIPKLKMIGANHESPPIREFEEIDQSDIKSP